LPICFIIFCHLLAAREQLVHLAGSSCRCPRDPLAPGAVDHVRHAPLLRRHREHDRLDPRELLLVDVDALELLAQPGIIFSTPWSGPIFAASS
jgi:hypothetical protein